MDAVIVNVASALSVEKECPMLSNAAVENTYHAPLFYNYVNS
jgi:hypothetical protein